MIVVADTSPVLHLARVGYLDLIRATFGSVIVPRAVWSELVQLGTPGPVAEALRGADWIGVREDPALADRKGAIGEVAGIVAQLRADGFWLADDIVAEFLVAIGERP